MTSLKKDCKDFSCGLQLAWVEVDFTIVGGAVVPHNTALLLIINHYSPHEKYLQSFFRCSDWLIKEPIRAVRDIT